MPVRPKVGPRPTLVEVKARMDYTSGDTPGNTPGNTQESASGNAEYPVRHASEVRDDSEPVAGWDLHADQERRERQGAINLVVRCLSRREYSAQELLQKLAAKHFPQDLSESVVAEMQVTGLQCDERFAESFVRSRINRGQGPLRIRQELRHRGVAESLTDALLEQPESFWVEKAVDLLLKRQSSRSGLLSEHGADNSGEDDQLYDEPESPDPEARQAQFLARRRELASHSRFLANRGFGGHVVSSALNAVSRN